MSKLFACAALLGTVAAAAIVAGAGCASSTDERTGDNTQFASGDGGDAGGGPVRGSVVIYQVFGGGGLAGASFANDYVVLFNRTQKPFTLDGLSVQLSATATTPFSVAVPVTGSLPPGGYYLVKLGTADDASGDTALPTPADATSTAPIGSPKDGKVALAIGTNVLNCGGTGTLCSTSKLMDMVGFGQASVFEGQASAPALDATHAAIRNGNGCTDSDDNSKDFTSGTPAPFTSTQPAFVCPVIVKDAGTLPDGAPVPPVTDPPLGPESAFDGGYRPDAAVTPVTSGTGDNGCAIAAGRSDASSAGGFAALGLVAVALLRRRRR